MSPAPCHLHVQSSASPEFFMDLFLRTGGVFLLMKGVVKPISAEAAKCTPNSLYKHFGLVLVQALILLPSAIIIISQRKRGAQASTRNSISFQCMMVCFVGDLHSLLLWEKAACVFCLVMAKTAIFNV